MMGHVTIAQSIKTYSGETTVKLEGGKIDCKEKYNYYVDDNGNYVKSGNYSLSGTSNSFTYQGNVSATYSIVATYKNGILDGHLTAKLIIKGRGEWLSWARSYKTYDIERILSASFKDGVPDGQWTYTEKGLMDDDNSIYKTTFTCENGKFVGDFNCNFSGLNVPKHQQGSFDQNGNLLSVTIQGGGAGKGAGIGVGDVGTKEYHLNSNGDLLSYFHRDYNNQAIDHYRYDDILMKEYETQSLSPKTFLEDKGYYLTKKTDEMNIGYSSYTFGTATIVQYILQQLYLKPTEFFGSPSYLEGFGRFSGLFDSYKANKYEFEKKPVKAFAESDLLAIKNHLEYNADFFNEMADTAVVSEVINYAIKEKDMYLISISDTLRYFDETQCTRLRENINDIWYIIKDSIKIEKEKRILAVKEKFSKFANNTTEEIMNNVRGCYGERKSGTEYITRNDNCSKLLTQLVQLLPIGFQNISESDMYGKFSKFSSMVSFNIDDYTLNKDYDTCIVYVTIFTDKDEPIHTTVWFDRIYSGDVTNTQYVILRWNESFKKSSAAPIWNNIAELKNNVKKLDDQVKSYKDVFPEIVADYKKEGISLKNRKDSPQAQQRYYSDVLIVQKRYIDLIDIRKQIDERTKNILQLATDYKDIAKSYQEIRKTWDMKGEISDRVKRFESVLLFQNHCVNFIAKRKIISEKNAEINASSGKKHADVAKSFANLHKGYNFILSIDTNDNNSRLDGFVALQDSCLTFIELRKTITQNNAKIAGYAKAAPTIVKAYNTYMKGVNLTWTPEPSRNQAIREIINTQNALINELSKPNISEVDKTVKKSKAKTWEDVKKIVFQ